MSLTNPEITELTSESAAEKLLNEWLALYFDGGSHVVGSNDPVVFPKANRAFGQGKPAQPLFKFTTGVDTEIRCVILPRSEEAEANNTVFYRGKLVTDKVILQFWISAKDPGSGQAEYRARQMGELLKSLLCNPDTRYALAEKGITHLGSVGPAQPLPSADYHVRMLSCMAALQYSVNFGTSALNAPTSVEQSLMFYNESPLLAGEHLIGGYQWSVRTRLLRLVVTGWPPQGAPVVLGLEAGGELTGVEVTVPEGTANEDFVLPVSFEGVGPGWVLVEAGKLVRWRVLSAPVAEDSAWHLTLTLQAVPQ